MERRNIHPLQERMDDKLFYLKVKILKT